MLRKSILLTLILLAVVALGAAQEQRSEIAVQGTGFFTKDSSGQGVSQHAPRRAACSSVIVTGLPAGSALKRITGTTATHSSFYRGPPFREFRPTSIR